MSRIGKKPIQVPDKVKVSVAAQAVTVEGPLGKNTLALRPEVNVAFDDKARQVLVTIDQSDMDNRFVRAMWGTTRAHINNMIVGVTKGYEKQLEVHGVGYAADLSGKRLKVVVGRANPTFLEVPAGLNVATEKGNVPKIVIKGVSKDLVGQFAAKVRSVKKPEPYKGKGVRYVGEVVRQKEGKKFGA